MIKNASGFEIYLNCANPETAAKIMQEYPIDGITSNPQMIATQNNGRTDLKNIIKELRQACGPDKLLFLQTPSNDFDDIMKDARELREVGGPNTIVKIPTCREGIKAIETLTSMSIPTLGTQVLSTMQGILALKAGAKYNNFDVIAPADSSNIDLLTAPKADPTRFTLIGEKTDGTSNKLAYKFGNTVRVDEKANLKVKVTGNRR